MKITIPELSLVLLVGPSGYGKSKFARQHFKPTEVLSSDYCHGLVSDNENDQTATKDAFEVLPFIAQAFGRLHRTQAFGRRKADCYRRNERPAGLAKAADGRRVALSFPLAQAGLLSINVIALTPYAGFAGA